MASSQPQTPNHGASYVDLAHALLKAVGKPIHYRSLIAEVFRLRDGQSDVPPRVVAQIHTEINLDSRFTHKGEGLWGLRQWSDRKARLVPMRAARKQRDDDEAELDEILGIDDFERERAREMSQPDEEPDEADEASEPEYRSVSGRESAGDGWR